MIIEIPNDLMEDFIKATSNIQDKYYVMQASEHQPEIRQKFLEKFMAAANILQKLENGID